MITVKKDAIKVKTSEGMQSVGVLCKVGTFGVDYLRYVNSATITNLDLFNEENLVLNLDNATSFYTLMNSANNTMVKSLTINCPNQITQANYMLARNNTYEMSPLERVVLNADTSKCTRFDYMFSRQQSLIEILGIPLNLSSATNNLGGIFSMCQALVEVRFVQNTIKMDLNIGHSGNLSDASIDSLVNGFADMTGQNAIVLTVRKDVKARIEANEVWLSTLTLKNVTLA